jgi:DNA-binding XRE family transcriptional regulator
MDCRKILIFYRKLLEFLKRKSLMMRLKELFMRNDQKHHSESFLLTLGDAIRARRIDLFLSQQDLGSNAKLHRTYVTEVENGLRNISMITLLKIAKALKSRPSALVISAEKAIAREGRKSE